ncbi:MAG: glycosyltransferase family 39 protein, partial [Rhizobiales bacterium]|nr:glycosyltransferase family 39 protein [Rhizobacter sp.]
MTTRPTDARAGGGTVEPAPAWSNVWLIVGVALLLRLVWAVLVPVEPLSDSYLYDGFAKNIAFGKGYAFPGGDLTVYWPVGASAVFAAIYKVFGTGDLPSALFLALLGAATVWMTWRLARRYSGPVAAGVAAWFVALWPVLIEFTTILASELMFVALVLAALNVW